MNYLSLFPCLFLLVCTAKSEMLEHKAEDPASIDDSLVTIESTYRDLAASDKTVRVKGSGFLVVVNDQYFVVTASHVSQGEQIVLHHQGQLLKIKGRYYVDVQDLEVIEVESVTKTSSFIMAGNAIEWRGQTIGRTRWVDGLSFVLLNDWVQDPNLKIDNLYAQQKLSMISCDLLCQLLESVSLMQPGSSGSPLVVKVPNRQEWAGPSLPFDAREGISSNNPDKYFLRGLVIRRDRFFARSSFVPAHKISLALRDYLSGSRTDPKPRASWKVSGNLMFRIFESNLHESSAVSGSSGNGVSMDGGDLVDLQEENPREVLSNLSAVPVSGGAPRYFWIMAMRHPKGYFMSAPLWFDMEQYLSMYRFTLSVSPEEEDKDKILNIFLARFGEKGPPAQLASQDGSSKINFTKGFVQIEIRTSEGAFLSFFLNRFGFYCQNPNSCDTKFMAIIEVPASDGQIYFVDLRGFLFVHFSLDKTDAFRDPKILTLSKDEYQNFLFDHFAGELQNIHLTYRRKRSVQTPLSVEEGQVNETIWTIP